MKLPVEEVDFEQHMREKARMWEPFTVTIGEDVAVFEFDTNVQRDIALSGVMYYASSYGYSVHKGSRERLAIVKGEDNAKD